MPPTSQPEPSSPIPEPSSPRPEPSSPEPEPSTPPPEPSTSAPTPTCGGRWKSCERDTCNYEVMWEFDNSKDEIKFSIMAKVSQSQWVAIGFSDDQAMVGFYNSYRRSDTVRCHRVDS